MPQDGAVCPMCEWMMGLGWGAMLIMALFWIALIALVAWAVYRIARGRGWIGASDRPATPEEVLDERYARGEIDRDEYLRMRDDLEPDGRS